ncbi:MAG: type I restriction-modification system subunit M N-terminal domain-containing protein [Pseudomonadales bacterium]|nr:type I restriction-modification system subunit M N-terminal domain-containing protein [Pseudomonadales bacterium]
MNTESHSQTTAFLWSVADLLRGDFKQSQYGRIILPFTLLRRMECVLESTKAKVLSEVKAHQNKSDTVREQLLLRASGHQYEQGNIVVATKGKNKGKPEADSSLRNNENVPLGQSVYDYFEREVKPHVPDAWIDESKTDALDGEVGIAGFEIPFNRHFYVFKPPRPLEEIDTDLKQCTDRIKQMIEELSA